MDLAGCPGGVPYPVRLNFRSFRLQPHYPAHFAPFLFSETFQ
jgi:hypothetical protein